MTPVFVITAGDVFGFALTVLCALVALGLWLPGAWRQGRCKHDGDFRETMACDAICDKCGKNLGFIQPWRDRKAARERGQYSQGNKTK